VARTVFVQRTSGHAFGELHAKCGHAFEELHAKCGHVFEELHAKCGHAFGELHAKCGHAFEELHAKCGHAFGELHAKCGHAFGELPAKCSVLIPYMLRIGQNHTYTPYTTVRLVIAFPRIPYIHRIYMVLANPVHAACTCMVKANLRIVP